MDLGFFGPAPDPRSDGEQRHSFPPRGNVVYVEGHTCSEVPIMATWDDYGAAIGHIYTDATGRAWADNGEYGTEIIFCPFCGERINRVWAPKPKG